MDQNDQKLLERQLRNFQAAPRNTGVMMLMLVGAFVVGISFGSFVTELQPTPPRVASNDATLASPSPTGAPTIR